MTEPFYYKYKTKIVGSKTVVGSQYHCHKCQKFIQDTETPLEHYFTSFHNKTNPEWKQYATVLSNLLQKRNTIVIPPFVHRHDEIFPEKIKCTDVRYLI